MKLLCGSYASRAVYPYARMSRSGPLFMRAAARKALCRAHALPVKREGDFYAHFLHIYQLE